MKKKILLLIGICFLVSGCSVNYELEIYNNRWNEKITDSLTENGETSPSEYITKKLIEFDGSESIRNRKLTDKDKNTLIAKYSGNLKEYTEQAFDVTSCYDLYKINEYDGVITVLTSKTFNCFEHYKDLDKVTVMIKSNHKLIETNADKVDGYKYYWTIEKETKDDEKILLKLDSNKFVFNYEGSFVKKVLTIVGIIAIISLIGFITYKYFTKRSNKVNEI